MELNRALVGAVFLSSVTTLEHRNCGFKYWDIQVNKEYATLIDELIKYLMISEKLKNLGHY